MAGTVKRRGDFFGVELETFHRVCALNDPDVCAAYLILAAGTGADNRTSTWSREAVNQRTSLNWRQARDAVSRLKQAGLVRCTKSGARPRYDLPPYDARESLPLHIADLVTSIAAGEQPSGRSAIAMAAHAAGRGHLRKGVDGRYEPTPPTKPQYAWLPKTIVDGAASERPPVERVRRARDAMAFRMLVDLYSIQDLAENGGVDRQWLRRKFKRSKSHANGSFQVWQFEYENEYVSWGGVFDVHKREPTPEEKKEGKNRAQDVFERLSILQDAGLLEWVYYLTEDEGEKALLIHPVALTRQNGTDDKAIETIVGSYAIRAGVALSTNEERRSEAWATYYETTTPKLMLLPAEKLLRQVQVVGVPRLRYRAKTSNAARWQQDLHEQCPEYIRGYRQIVSEHAPELLDVPDHRHADFNVTSMLDQRGVQRDINDSSGSASIGVPSPSGDGPHGGADNEGASRAVMGG